MIDELSQVADAAQQIDRAVRKVKAQHINERAVKDLIRVFVQTYFTRWRPTLVERLGSEAELVSLDSTLQNLLRHAQRRVSVREYRATLRLITEELRELELKSLLISSRGSNIQFEPHHVRILQSLKDINESAAKSYEQGLIDLQAGTRSSWRGTAVEFREALREVLHQLAPDDEVESQPNFKREPDTKGPTMKQKAVFILRARRAKKPQVKTFTEALDVVDELIGNLARSVYTRSSVAVHVADSREEARKVRDFVSLVLAELLEVGD
jgi:hypothetical protein